MAVYAETPTGSCIAKTRYNITKQNITGHHNTEQDSTAYISNRADDIYRFINGISRMSPSINVNQIMTAKQMIPDNTTDYITKEHKT